jgi:hypothetical protein
MSPVLNLRTFRSAPNAPSNLAGTVVSAQEVDLSWSPPNADATLFQFGHRFQGEARVAAQAIQSINQQLDVLAAAERTA